MTRGIHRRAFLGRSVLLGGAAAGLNRSGECAAAEPSSPEETSAPAKSEPDVILHRGGYPGWPWVTPAREGRLVCVFRDDGIHGFSPTGKVMWTFSRDQGHTWAPARVVVDEPGVDERKTPPVKSGL